jgi:hypothetical protein
VRLLKPDELPKDWDPIRDHRLTVWEMVHHLIRELDKGESAAAALVAKLGTKAEVARELAYRLYTLCERKKRAHSAIMPWCKAGPRLFDWRANTLRRKKQSCCSSRSEAWRSRTTNVLAKRWTF